MKLPSLLEMKRLGYRALKQSWEPSALERGIQFLREGAFVGLDIARKGSSGQRIEFSLNDPNQNAATTIDFESPAQPTYSNCNCSHANHGIFCKHQAAGTLILTLCLGDRDETARLPDGVWTKIESFKDQIDGLRMQKAKTAIQIPTQVTSELTGILILETITEDPVHSEDVKIRIPEDSDFERSPVLPYVRSNEIFAPHCLYFRFADETLIPASKVLYHQNAKSIPHELIPTQTNMQKWWEAFRRYFSHGRLELYYGRIPPAVATIHSSTFFGTSPIKACKVKVLWSEEKTPWKVGYQIQLLETGGISLQIPDAPEGWILGDQFAFNSAESGILLHQLKDLKSTLPTNPVLNSSRDFSKWYEVQISKKHPPVLNFSPRPIFLNSEQFQTEINISSKGDFEFQFKTTYGAFSGLSTSALTWIEICQNGLGSICPIETEELIEIRKTSKRGSDVKLLRHAGVAVFILQEVLRTMMNQRELTQDQQTKLDLKVLDLLQKLDGTPSDTARSLDHFCSKAAVEIYRNCIKIICDQFWNHNPFTWDLQNFYFFNSANRLYAQWILCWIQGQARHQGAQYLFRSRDAFVDAECSASLNQHMGLGIGSRPFRLLSKKQFNVDRLLRAFTQLPDQDFEIYLDGAKVEELSDADFKSEFKLEEIERPSGKIDWFELNPKFFLKGTEITEEQAKALSQQGMIRFNGKVYRLPAQALPSMEQLAKFWDQISSIEPTKKKGKFSDRVYHLPRHATLELLLLRRSGVEIQGGKHWQAVCDFFDILDKERSLPEIPKTFTGELKHYQVLGLAWIHDLYRLGLGGILADDMGLGKTVQALAFLESLRLSKDLGQSLIIVPTSLTFNWLTESKRFTPDLPVHLFHSREIDKAHQFLQQNENGLLITTYGLLAEHVQFFSQFKWNIHIYDEAQNLKTITAKRTAASRQLPAQFKLCLTGTPLENHLGEFYSLLDLVVPGALGALDKFRKTYLTSYAPEPERIQYLKLKTKPLVLRRTKSAILKELPEKTESAVKIPFTDKQLKIYRDIALSWNSKVRENIQKEGTAKSQIIMLTALLRLRQACSAPSAIPNVKYDETPPKIALLVDTLQEIVESGESALVFTQFMGTFHLIEKELKAANIPYFFMHGKVQRKDREIQLQKFQEFSKGAVMLMTLKTGGVGLNLTKASYVFHLEPWWNPAVENQATDRTHRIGQTRPVQVYRYIMSESVEEKIEILKERKSAQFQALFTDAEIETDLSNASGSLTQADFEYLLGIQSN